VDYLFFSFCFFVTAVVTWFKKRQSLMSERRLKRNISELEKTDTLEASASNNNMTTECCVCQASLFHYAFEPVHMGCQCTEKICNWCVVLGNVVNCPTCRKHRRKPIVDHTWLHSQMIETESQSSISCSGCDKDFKVCDISSHERRCIKYRDYLDSLHVDNVVSHRDRANQCETEMKVMTERLELQEDEMEEMEDACNSYKVLLAAYEAEKRVYAYEQQNMLAALNKVSRPILTLSKKVHEIQAVVDSLKEQIRESKENHKQLCAQRRRLGFDGEQSLNNILSGSSARVEDTDDETDDEGVGNISTGVSYVGDQS
jgi:hypothetical protein